VSVGLKRMQALSTRSRTAFGKRKEQERRLFLSRSSQQRRVHSAALETMSTPSASIPAPPLALDHSSNSYFVLSTSSSSPPPLPSLALATPLSYVGPIGPGIMATEHVVALPDSTVDGSTSQEEVKRVVREVRKVEGVQGVEVMQARTREKR
jgi:hypothetical protein